jgi:hypothetical protein
MRGAIGTATGGGSSRKWAIKRNLPALIHAKDILALHRRGEPDIHQGVLAACDKAVNSPSLLLPHEGRIIHAVWRQFAETGKLRGIRNSIFWK